MVNKVEICGVNTAKLPVYKDAEMKEMMEKIKAGDKEVKDEFIKGNLRLVLSVIQRKIFFEAAQVAGCFILIRC